MLLTNNKIRYIINTKEVAIMDVNIDISRLKEGQVIKNYKELSSTSVACNLLFNLSIMFPSTAF